MIPIIQWIYNGLRAGRTGSGAREPVDITNALPAGISTRVGRFVLVWLGTLIPFFIAAQPELEWFQTYGGDLNDNGVAITRTQDGGFAIVGYTTSFGAGAEDVLLIKINEFGELQWQRTFGGQHYDWPAQIIEMEDGGFAIAATTRSFGEHPADYWLIRTDSEGDSLWSRTYGMRNNQVCTDMCLRPEGGFALTGINPEDVWLVFADEDGDSLFSSAYDFGHPDYSNVIIPIGEEGYAIGVTKLTFKMLRVTSEGDILWGTYSFSRSDHDEVMSIQRGMNGSFLLIGYSFTGEIGGLGETVGRIVEVDSTHNRPDNRLNEWIIDEPNNRNWFTSSDTCRDGNLILGGDADDERGHKFWMMKMSLNGDSLWSRTFDEGSPSTCRKILALHDGSYILMGSSGMNGREDQDILVIKVSPENRVAYNEYISIPIISSLYPNPSNGYISVQFNLIRSGFINIELLDNNGRSLRTLSSIYFNSGNHLQTIDISSVSSGQYTILFMPEFGGYWAQRIVLLK